MDSKDLRLHFVIYAKSFGACGRPGIHPRQKTPNKARPSGPEVCSYPTTSQTSPIHESTPKAAFKKPPHVRDREPREGKSLYQSPGLLQRCSFRIGDHPLRTKLVLLNMDFRLESSSSSENTWPTESSGRRRRRRRRSGPSGRRMKRRSHHDPATETGLGAPDSGVFNEFNADASAGAIPLEVAKLATCPLKRQALAICEVDGNPAGGPLPMTWPLAPGMVAILAPGMVAIKATARRFEVDCGRTARPFILVEVQSCTLVVPLELC